MLDTAQIEDFLNLRLPEAQTLEILAALTPENITLPLLKQIIDAMKPMALAIPTLSTAVLDCCGTGGSGVSHFNTSTASAFVLAAGGVPVVKFGNRAMSSLSGSFDFLEALGLPAEIPLERLPDILETWGVAFLYAPQCYPALGRFNALRRQLGVRTVFNFIGPLLNPVNPAFRVLGVSHPGMQTMLAEYLTQHTQKALVVRGEPTLDEINPNGKTMLVEVFSDQITQRIFDSQHTTVYQPTDNALLFEKIIAGEETDSWAHRAICLNAGAGFYVAGKTDSIETGAELAAELIKDHDVQAVLSQCRRAYADFG